jgi:hypothetical protein
MSVDFRTPLAVGTTWEVTAELSSFVPFSAFKQKLEGARFGKFHILEVEQTGTNVNRFWPDSAILRIRFEVTDNPILFGAWVAGVLIVAGLIAAAFIVHDLRQIFTGAPGAGSDLIAILAVAGVIVLAARGE